MKANIFVGMASEKNPAFSLKYSAPQIEEVKCSGIVLRWVSVSKMESKFDSISLEFTIKETFLRELIKNQHEIAFFFPQITPINHFRPIIWIGTVVRLVFIMFEDYDLSRTSMQSS